MNSVFNLETVTNEEQRIELLTRELVATKSVNGTKGEVDLVEKLEKILRSFTVFKEHPQWVWTQKIDGDLLGRKNIFAFLGKEGTHKTVLYHSHFDTVGLDDFGSIKEKALDPDYLEQYFTNYDSDREIQNDASSGDWLFGRGALDMKSGDAVNIANLLYFSEHPKLQKGNLLFMGNCVEENDHSGVIAALDELKRLQEEWHLQYSVAINTDFISPKYAGDTQKYIYYGAAGKTLTCFYIKGIETHVGNTYAGIDSTLIASRINVLINNNPAFVEDIPGEEILPSSCLMLRDQKDFYNVQTAKVTEMYFNTFTYKKPVFEIIEQLKEAVKLDCEQLVVETRQRENKFLSKLNFPAGDNSPELNVYSFEEYLKHLAELGIDYQKLINNFIGDNGELDKRSAGFKLIDYLDQQINDNEAKVILFLAPPFCPHNSITKDSKVYQNLEETLNENDAHIDFTMKQFFPYLSDSSYLMMDESPQEVEKMKNIFPLADQLYPLPYDKMRELNIPAVDIGVYGKGAHTWKERVYKPYSFVILPKLIRNYTQKIWKN
ncbi:M20/M25/M40 family metallo-hydrolase [Liquorilactobacillus hordei]|uniref:M20/M25/M40 family metallo-hydrolase n=1 Tax=Liquorilactobacillus hordei TaxID=468911 RepID=UPI0039ECD4AD